MYNLGVTGRQNQTGLPTSGPVYGGNEVTLVLGGLSVAAWVYFGGQAALCRAAGLVIVVPYISNQHVILVN